MPFPDRHELEAVTSDATANVVGPLLAYEGADRFSFLEAAFLGVLLFRNASWCRPGPISSRR